MNTNGFVIYILALTVGVLQAHSMFKDHFNGKAQFIDHIEQLEQRISSEQFRARLIQFQHEEFRQEVATLLPEAIQKQGGPKKAKTYPLRNLASVVSKQSGDHFRVQKAKSLFEKGKKHFREGDFITSNAHFGRIVKHYPYSINLVEAYFFLSEGQFQNNELESCLGTVEKMLSLFPESELTGFALLRMGKIYELQDRREDAIDLYQTVLRSFPQRGVASQARTSLRSVDL